MGTKANICMRLLCTNLIFEKKLASGKILFLITSHFCSTNAICLTIDPWLIRLVLVFRIFNPSVFNIKRLLSSPYTSKLISSTKDFLKKKKNSSTNLHK